MPSGSPERLIYGSFAGDAPVNQRMICLLHPAFLKLNRHGAIGVFAFRKHQETGGFLVEAMGDPIGDFEIGARLEPEQSIIMAGPMPSWDG